MWEPTEYKTTIDGTQITISRHPHRGCPSGYCWEVRSYWGALTLDGWRHYCHDTAARRFATAEEAVRETEAFMEREAERERQAQEWAQNPRLTVIAGDAAGPTPSP
jgi:hypothetical protein